MGTGIMVERLKHDKTTLNSSHFLKIFEDGGLLVHTDFQEGGRHLVRTGGLPDLLSPSQIVIYFRERVYFRERGFAQRGRGRWISPKIFC